MNLEIPRIHASEMAVKRRIKPSFFEVFVVSAHVVVLAHLCVSCWHTDTCCAGTSTRVVLTPVAPISTSQLIIKYNVLLRHG